MMNLTLSFVSFDTFFFVIPVVLAVLIFLAARNILLWYWKVNELLNNQIDQIDLLTEIVELLKKQDQKI